MDHKPQKRGCTLIAFSLGYRNPELTHDEQVKCLSWLLPKIPAICAIPSNSVLKVIPAQYTGGPYPTFGLWGEGREYEEWKPNLSLIEDQIAAFVEKMGVKKLLELSATETLTWDEVLDTDSYWPLEKSG